MFYNSELVVRRIKELQGGESENSMANRLGISQVTLNYCLSGKRKPSLDIVYRICDMYGVSTDWLLGLSDVRARLVEGERETKLPENTQKGKILMPLNGSVCGSVRQSVSPSKSQETNEILCKLARRITELESKLAALSSTQIATCG